MLFLYIFKIIYVQLVCLQHLPALQQALIPEVEEKLRKRCENLVVMMRDNEGNAKSGIVLTVTYILVVSPVTLHISVTHVICLETNF